MSFIRKTVLCAWVILAYSAVSTGQTVINFDSIQLNGVDTFINDAGTRGGFRSELGFFPNEKFPFYWTGFSISNVEDTSTSGFMNQYAAASYTDVSGQGNYAVATGQENRFYVTFDGTGDSIQGLSLTNATYAYLSMRDGDMFTKKFSVSDSDYFHLRFIGFDKYGQETGEASILLADFRNVQGNSGTILKDWTWVDLRPLGRVAYVETELSSSDVGQFGMNTPAYFCIDSLVVNSAEAEFTPFPENDMDTISSFAAINLSVWSNDFEPDNDSTNWSVSIVNQPQEGTANFSSGVVSYQADSTGNGIDTDSLSYSLCNQAGNCDTATVYIYWTVEIDTANPGDSLTQISQHLDQDLDRIYPNPTKGNFLVSTAPKTRVQVLNVGGEVLYDKFSEDGKSQVDFNRTKPGLYFVRVLRDHEMRIYKVIKE